MTSRTTRMSPEPTTLHWVEIRSRSGQVKVKLGRGRVKTFDLWPRSNRVETFDLWLGSNEVKPLTFDRGQTRSNGFKTFDLWPRSNGVKMRSNLWPLTAVRLWTLTMVKRGQTSSNLWCLTVVKLWPLTAVKWGQTRSKLWPLTKVKRGQMRSQIWPWTMVKWGQNYELKTRHQPTTI